MDSKFECVIREIDRVNREDPTVTSVGDQQIPAALLYGQRMTMALVKFAPDASERLRIAARGQHIRRWSVPRNSYRMDRKGYLAWRTRLKIMHADLIKAIMTEQGYSQEEAQITGDLVLKKRLKQDPEAQALEDVVCLVFLQYYFEDFIHQHEEEEEKIVGILRKTWHKMSEKGHEAALALELPEKGMGLVKKAMEATG
ncbi:MAG: DUF4202 domain-containing protein [Cytophagales bacterium]|nr:DUF4202 domain-containing protein [Cytophagales bacterium]